MTERPDRAGTFWPVVLAGLAGSALTAVASFKSMLRIDEGFWADIGAISFADTGVSFPLAGALALVALASWGVLLVVRGVVRRAVAGLAAVAGLGVLVVLVVQGVLQRDQHAEAILDQMGAGSLAPDAPIGATGWFWAAALGALVSGVAAVAAVRLAPSWPEMGQRYDAPTSSGPATRAGDAVPPEERASIDLWKSLDEGDDPTAH